MWIPVGSAVAITGREHTERGLGSGPAYSRYFKERDSQSGGAAPAVRREGQGDVVIGRVPATKSDSARRSRVNSTNSRPSPSVSRQSPPPTQRSSARP
jgi:hypothetical protein